MIINAKQHPCAICMTLDRTYRTDVGVCTAIRWFSGSMIRRIVKTLHMGAYIIAKKENMNFLLVNKEVLSPFTSFMMVSH